QISQEVWGKTFEYLHQQGHIKDSVEDGGYTFYVIRVAKKKYVDSSVIVYRFGGNLEHGKIMFLVEYSKNKPKSSVNRFEFLATTNSIESILEVFDFLQNHDFGCSVRDRILSVVLFDYQRSRL